MAFSQFSAFWQAATMIKDSVYAPATDTVCALVVFLWVLYRFTLQSQNTLTLRLKLPPGPLPWPIIGNLNQLKMLPHRDLHELAKKYGPIIFLKLGSFPTIVVSSSSMAKEFLKTHDVVFASRPLTAAGKYIGYNFKDVVFAPYGSYWRPMRKLCAVELFNSKRIESFRCIREEEMISAVRSVWEMSGHGKTPVNLTNVSSSFVQAVMWRILSGTKISFHGGAGSDGQVEEIKKLAAELAATAGAVNIGDFIPYLDWLDLNGVKRRMKKAHTSMDQVIRKIIEEHQQRRAKIDKEHKQQFGPEDIIDVLLKMENFDGVEVTEKIVRAIVFDIFVAGIETTSVTLAWAMSAILKSPSVAQKMQEEIESVVGRERGVSEADVAKMEYVQCVGKETLRLYPTVPLLLPHESTEDCIVGEYFIPERSRLIINAWAIGRDPSVWEDPLEFRPERFMGKNVDIVRDKNLFDMLPFGAGRRGCPGSGMAIVTINFVLAQLIHCFEWNVEGDLDMTEAFGTSMSPSVDLVARPALRLSSCP